MKNAPHLPRLVTWRDLADALGVSVVTARKCRDLDPAFPTPLKDVPLPGSCEKFLECEVLHYQRTLVERAMRSNGRHA